MLVLLLVISAVLAVNAQCPYAQVEAAQGPLPRSQPEPAQQHQRGTGTGGDVPVTQTVDYNPQKVDWKGVISACHAATRYERRMAGFCLRSAFHDAMSINATCARLKSPQEPGYDCGGADGSLLLCEDEQVRTENGLLKHSFARRTAAMVKTISAEYGCSAADALAVCAMTTVRVLGSFDLLTSAPLRVGRVDNPKCNPKGQLPPDNATSAEAIDFFTERNVSVDHGVALLGVHALVPTKGCVLEYQGQTAVECDPMEAMTRPVAARGPQPLPKPKNGSCQDIQMFTFNNRWFLDLCTPTITVGKAQTAPSVDMLSEAEWRAVHKKTACQYTSDAFRTEQMTLLEKARLKEFKFPARQTSGIKWSNQGCPSGPAPGFNASQGARCPHPETWYYPRNDGFIGLSCQVNESDPRVSDQDKEIKEFMLEYAYDNEGWQHDFAEAFSVMMDSGVKWSRHAFYPTWAECPSGCTYKPQKHGKHPSTKTAGQQQAIAYDDEDDDACASCNADLPVRTEADDVGAPEGYSCPEGCVCSTAYGSKEVLVVDASMCGPGECNTTLEK